MSRVGPEPANGQEGAEYVFESSESKRQSSLRQNCLGGMRRGTGRSLLRAALGMVFAAALAMAGCSSGGISLSTSTSTSSNGNFSISPGDFSIDTNCTGCNQANSGYEQFTATTSGGGVASVTWTVSGGDRYAKAGTISSSGQYVPPAYLTADTATVTVTATSTANANDTATATVTITPGFHQPLTPENAALGANGTVTVTGYISEVGGTDGIEFATANTANGSSGGQGTLASTSCVRGTVETGAFTYCSAKYTAPQAVSQTGTTFVVGTIGGTSSKESTVVLLNSEGVDSSPSDHQERQTGAIALGASGGSDADYDVDSNGQIIDCCGGTLGALVRDSNGNQYILSNNHVLARSDEAKAGEMIIQPGLIDNDPACQPEDQGGNETPVGVLKGFVPIKSTSTNVDAAIASVNSGAVNTAGAILELGAPSGGMLAAAPPGTSCTIPSAEAGVSCVSGKGETPAVNMVVAKSGRTTGLTCASIAAVSLRVQVSYYTDCAETNAYYTKTYTNQFGIEGNQFSDAGDSGSLVVDTANGEPVGLFFAGGSANGISEGVANPVGEVLNELSSYVGSGTSYSFVGTNDHAVSCLDYGSGTAAAAQARSLSGAEMDRVQQAMTDARGLVNPSAGILGVATGKSSDRAGEGTVIVYVDPEKSASVPATLDGVRTEVIPASAQAVAMGAAPQSLLQAGVPHPLPVATLRQAIGIQQQIAGSLMKQTPAFFGVGVGQSLDNPQEAALVIYVDKNQVPATLPQTIDGLRTRYIIMERLHVTRSYLSAVPRRSDCGVRSVPASGPASGFELLEGKRLRGLRLY